MNRAYDDLPKSYQQKVGFEYTTDSFHEHEIYQMLKKILPTHFPQVFFLTAIRDNWAQIYSSDKSGHSYVLANIILDGENFTLVPVNGFKDFLDDVSYAAQKDSSQEAAEKDLIDSEKKQLLIDYLKFQVSNLLYKQKNLN